MSTSIRTRKVKNAIFMTIITILLLAISSGTYSRYTMETEVTANSEIARWKIQISNGSSESKDISTETNAINLTAKPIEGLSSTEVSKGKWLQDKLYQQI